MVVCWMVVENTSCA